MMVKGEIAFSGGAEGVKTLYKLSGKRTMTGLRSGEYACVKRVTDGEPGVIQANLSGNRDRDKEGQPFLSLSFLCNECSGY